jgi:hypothetical protein
VGTSSCLVPLSLVLDLLIVHERFGSSSDLSINGHLHNPNDLDNPPLNEVPADKIRGKKGKKINRFWGLYLRVDLLKSHTNTRKEEWMDGLTTGLGRVNGESCPIVRTHVGLCLVWGTIGRCSAR